ncbi:MAG: type I restriction endonuclease [Candidatus Bathyarchaeota archaeon]|nr:type I restriction endonuclease [Candidatus Bathyarchaeota archaeon]
MVDPDAAFIEFKKILESFDISLKESDVRSKIIDPILINCLGWDNNDIKREVSINEGSIDYVLYINNAPWIIVEAKRANYDFVFPDTNKKDFSLRGVIMNDENIKNGIDQCARYCSETGVNYAIITNGHQIIIFEGYRPRKQWRDGDCLVFKSKDDCIRNFNLLYDLVSKKRVMNNSFEKIVSKNSNQIQFEKTIDSLPDKDNNVGKNNLSIYFTKEIEDIFGPMTDNTKLDLLSKCYVEPIKNISYDAELEIRLKDSIPLWATNLGVQKLDNNDANFQKRYEICKTYLLECPKEGLLVCLLGGIGSGKTTFMHHFFKIFRKNKTDIAYFFIDFKTSYDESHIKQYIYDEIVNYYNLYYKNLAELKDYNFELKATDESMLTLFSLLKSQKIMTNIIIDNIDQKEHISSTFLSNIIDISAYLAKELKTIIILNLREESWFKNKKMGILDTYETPKYHIASPNVDDLLTSRLNYAIITIEKKSALTITNFMSPESSDPQSLKLFFQIIKKSFDSETVTGRKNIKFFTFVSGGNMRQVLDYLKSYMTSANTDINEMFFEYYSNKYGYQIPMHHIMKSCLLGDKKYYNEQKGLIMNIFKFKPEFGPMHFLNLRILSYLNIRKDSIHKKYGGGFVNISDLKEAAISSRINEEALNSACDDLGQFELVMFNHNLPDNYNTAEALCISDKGKYFLNELIYEFTYIDAISLDVYIRDEKIRNELRTINQDIIKYSDDNAYIVDKTYSRFRRTDRLIDYLKSEEIFEFENNPFLKETDFGSFKLMDRIKEKLNDEKYIIIKSAKRMQRQKVWRPPLEKK